MGVYFWLTQHLICFIFRVTAWQLLPSTHCYAKTWNNSVTLEGFLWVLRWCGLGYDTITGIRSSSVGGCRSPSLEDLGNGFCFFQWPWLSEFTSSSFSFGDDAFSQKASVMLFYVLSLEIAAFTSVCNLQELIEFYLKINLEWWARTKLCWIQHSTKNTCPEEMLLLVFAPAFFFLFH